MQETQLIKYSDKMKAYLIHGRLIFLSLLVAGLFSCAEEEKLLVSDTRYTGLLPDEGYSTMSQAVSDYIANRYLKISAEENYFLYLADSLNLMEINEVYMPEGDDFTPGNYNFGWPVAVMEDASIIVSTQRMLLPGQTDDKSGKGQLLIRSEDRGKTWTSISEVQFIQPYGYTAGSSSCIGSFDGKIIQKGSGTIISENEGSNWSPYPRAFKLASQESYGANGPKIHDHPEFGLIFFTGTSSEHDTGSVFRSDDGTIWEDTDWSVSGSDDVICPSPSALLLDDGSILMVSSNGANMVQYFYKYEPGDTYSDIEFTATVIPNISTSLSDFDVPDLITNPVSERIEMLESNPTSLFLWSADPSEIKSGTVDWEYECLPLVRSGVASLHPAGSVVDTENNLQHIYVYIGGLYPDRNCIFSITRTLDTESLSDWVNDYRNSN